MMETYYLQAENNMSGILHGLRWNHASRKEVLLKETAGSRSGGGNAQDEPWMSSKNIRVKSERLWSQSKGPSQGPKIIKRIMTEMQRNVGKMSYLLRSIRKGRGTRDQIANICWIIKKAREFQKNIYFCFIDYAKAFDCVDHKLWKIL